MQIAVNCVVAIDYTLRNDAGEILDTSAGRDPLIYLHGHGNIIPGLERELLGKVVGASVYARVAPQDGYGLRDPDRIQEVPRTAFPKNMNPEVGMQLMARDPSGNQFPLWITEVKAEAVVVDGNHPLAGETLHFQVEIKEVRAASEEELAHGHVHGPGGHGH
jgi:FKBP-type peptidyl-prolyl cis-trans isomerase SlyD